MNDLKQFLKIFSFVIKIWAKKYFGEKHVRTKYRKKDIGIKAKIGAYTGRISRKG